MLQFGEANGTARGNFYSLHVLEQGFREGDAGVHDAQSLVLVNHGSATGHEIVELSDRIVQSVKDKYGVALEREVNIA